MNIIHSSSSHQCGTWGLNKMNMPGCKTRIITNTCWHKVSIWMMWCFSLQVTMENFGSKAEVYFDNTTELRAAFVSCDSKPLMIIFDDGKKWWRIPSMMYNLLFGGSSSLKTQRVLPPQCCWRTITSDNLSSGNMLLVRTRLGPRNFIVTSAIDWSYRNGTATHQYDTLVFTACLQTQVDQIILMGNLDNIFLLSKN